MSRRRNILFLLVVILALLASCDVQIDHVDDGGKAVDSTAVGFGAYVYRGVSTKAGWNDGVLTGETIKNPEAGFGVFGYASQSLPYNERSKPDFMYNQPVKHPSDRWTYEPVKYWPNEETASVSFFAYAPFVEVNPSTGVVGDNSTEGILGMTHHLAEGDPQVRYSTTLMPGNDVDLCWGIPFLNEKKMGTGERLQFKFHHALSQLNVQIDTDSDAASQAAEETRIYVRSVTFTGFAIRGSLNLNSVNAPIWNDISGTERPRREPVTVYDGRIDGAEGRIGSIDAGEKLATLNPAIIQSAPYDVNVIDGVTGTTVNLFQNNNELEAPVLVIPLTGTPLSVTIVYDVETADDELTGFLSDGVTHGISVENRITQEVKLDDGTPMTLEAGKKNIVNLHLGLTGVKFSAEMTAWDDKEYGKADMPANIFKIGSMEITRGGSALTSITVWKNQTSLDAPDVTVKGLDGRPLTGVTINWSSDDTDIAEVDAEGAVILKGTPGTAKITAVATRADLKGSATASYDIYVNAVTGISVSPATVVVKKNENTTITASYTTTEIGDDYASLPAPGISWESGDESVITISSTSGSSVKAHGVELGSTTVTATIDDAYLAANADASASCAITCAPPALTAFRGYEVSPGILMRTVDGTVTTYSLTDGSNPFEPAVYYGNDSSIGTYFLTWSTLVNDLGTESSGIIDADSEKLPSGWIMPSAGDKWDTNPLKSDWGIIIWGTPKSTITVNGEPVTKNAYAMVKVTLEEGNSYGVPARTYYGTLLLRDGTNIPSGYLNVVSSGNYDSNPLDETTFKKLIDDYKCLFLSMTGMWSSGRKWEEMYSSRRGYYRARNSSGGTGYWLRLETGGGFNMSATKTNGNSQPAPVKLVKEL